MPTPTSPVRLERRPGDFRRRSVIFLQSGCTTTCTCCCLHWIGAGIGGFYGLRQAFRRPEDAPPIRPSARVSVRNAFWISLGVTAVLLPAGVALGEAGTVVAMSVAFIPSLFFVPAGLVALIWGFRTKSWTPADSANKEEVNGTHAWNLGCRIAWMTQLYAIAGGIIGYLVMWLIAVGGRFFR